MIFEVCDSVYFSNMLTDPPIKTIFQSSSPASSPSLATSASSTCVSASQTSPGRTSKPSQTPSSSSAPSSRFATSDNHRSRASTWAFRSTTACFKSNAAAHAQEILHPSALFLHSPPRSPYLYLACPTSTHTPQPGAGGSRHQAPRRWSRKLPSAACSLRSRTSTASCRAMCLK